MEIIEKFILKKAEMIIAKKGGSKFVNGVFVCRMSKEFHKWVYNEGYEIFVDAQELKKNKDKLKKGEG